MKPSKIIELAKQAYAFEKASPMSLQRAAMLAAIAENPGVTYSDMVREITPDKKPSSAYDTFRPLLSAGYGFVTQDKDPINRTRERLRLTADGRRALRQICDATEEAGP